MYQGKVFDITSYLPDHPGGDVIIVHGASPLHGTAPTHS
jgi:cytochrome b involved in lipid metabolism